MSAEPVEDLYSLLWFDKLTMTSRHKPDFTKPDSSDTGYAHKALQAYERIAGLS